MMDQLEALVALAESKTMTATATRLRITQSAISKRIASLEASVGKKLVERDGRRVRLTPFAVQLVERAAPVLAELREVVQGEAAVTQGRVVMGVSDSILASWGPALLHRVCQRIPELRIVTNAHRGPVVLERVRAGEYMLALFAGQGVDDLVGSVLFDEIMVVVPAHLKPLEPASKLKCCTMEAHSGTWRHLSGQLRRHGPSWPFKLEIVARLQSFTAIVQMARAGFHHGLVPEGIALAMGIARDALYYFPEPGLSRPVSLVGRSSTLARPLVRQFSENLKQIAADYCAEGTLIPAPLV